MLIFKDLITNDEMISDAFDIKEVDGALFEADCQEVVLKAGQVDIGANASAEEAAETLDDGDQRVNNIVHTFQLKELDATFDKKAYKTYIKGYIKAVKAYLVEKSPELVEEFEKTVQPAIIKILKSFDDYKCYTGSSMDPDGMIALLNYREDGITPFFTFLKHGLISEKPYYGYALQTRGRCFGCH